MVGGPFRKVRPGWPLVLVRTKGKMDKEGENQEESMTRRRSGLEVDNELILNVFCDVTVPLSTTKINSYDVRNRTTALAPRFLGRSVCPSDRKQEEAKGNNYVGPCPCHTLLYLQRRERSYRA